VPVWDWQFIVVSLVALGAVALIVRQVMPRRSNRSETGRAACANCPTHVESAKPSRTTVTPVVSLSDLRDTARVRRDP
jgi:hypothetical protein